MEGITIRQAQLQDAPALSALARETYTHAFGHSFTPGDLAAHLDGTLSPARFEQSIRDDIILLATKDGRDIGFMQFGRVTMDVEHTPGDRQLTRLYVDAAFQNAGIGSALMDTAFSTPLLQDAPAIYLDVWEHNQGARRFYERYGFKVIGEHRLTLASGAVSDRDLVMARRREP